MENLNRIIGKNFSNIRKESGLSLDEVSRQTGVSKGLLAQIERGESNPTVNTLWKIANGLQVSFTSLMEQEEGSVSIVSQKEIEPLTGTDSKYRAYLLFPYNRKRKFEIFTVELDPGCNHESEAHGSGVEEYVIVNEGTLELIHDDKIYKINQGDAINFPATKPHTYRNNTSTLTRIQVINFYSI